MEKEFISVPASRYAVDDDHDQIKVKEKGTIHKFFLYSSAVSNSQDSWKKWATVRLNTNQSKSKWWPCVWVKQNPNIIFLRKPSIKSDTFCLLFCSFTKLTCRIWVDKCALSLCCCHFFFFFFFARNSILFRVDHFQWSAQFNCSLSLSLSFKIKQKWIRFQWNNFLLKLHNNNKSKYVCVKTKRHEICLSIQFHSIQLK